MLVTTGDAADRLLQRSVSFSKPAGSHILHEAKYRVCPRYVTFPFCLPAVCRSNRQHKSPDSRDGAGAHLRGREVIIQNSAVVAHSLRVSLPQPHLICHHLHIKLRASSFYNLNQNTEQLYETASGSQHFPSSPQCVATHLRLCRHLQASDRIPQMVTADKAQMNDDC